MVPDPNEITLVLALVEANEPIVNVYPAAAAPLVKSKVPAVNVYTLVAANVKLAPSVTVPAVCVKVVAELRVPPL